MNHIVLIAAIGLLPTTTVFAQTASAPLIVVEDRGGASALPYYQSLNPQPDQATPPAPMPAPRAGNAADAEAAMLPVRSTQLSPGEVQTRVIRAPGLTALFLIGDDERSRAWLRQWQTALRELGAASRDPGVRSVLGFLALWSFSPGYGAVHDYHLTRGLGLPETLYGDAAAVHAVAAPLRACCTGSTAGGWRCRRCCTRRSPSACSAR